MPGGERIMKKYLVSMVVISLFIMTACNKGTSEPASTLTEKKIVETMTVSSKDINEVANVTGTLQPIDEVALSFELSGQIEKMNVEIGDHVKSGDVLAQLNQRDYWLNMQQAQTNIESANTTLEELKNGARPQEIKQAQIAVDKSQENYQKAKEDFERYQKLYKEGVISEQTFEDVELRLTIAKKEFSNAKEALSLVKEGARKEAIQKAEIAKEKALIAYEQAKRAFEKTKLTATFSGVVTEKLASTGQFISPGLPIYKVSTIHPLKVLLPVPDDQVQQWHVGKEVRLTLYNQTRQGKIVKIYPKTNQKTGTISIEVHVPNEEMNWFPGQVVTATYKLAQHKGIFVPAEAVISRGSEDPYVFVNKNGVAEKINVDVGMFYQNQYEILSGLNEGDEVVIKGADRLFDQDKIEVITKEGVKQGD